MSLYFAGPLFSHAELNFNKALTNKIQALGIEVFLPQRDGDSVNQEPIISLPSEERARVIFELDKKRLLETDIFLYILDGRVPDEGAAVALGMAYMHKEHTERDLKLIGLQTDKRAAFMGEKLNPMIFSALDDIFHDEEALLTYLSAEDMWSDYLRSINETSKATDKSYEAWGFGIGVEMANELAQLVVEGKKSATASLKCLYDFDNEDLPAVGEHSVILDGQERATCVIKTTAIDVIPFEEVTEAFARKEGEGDLSLRYWQEGHESFFSEELKEYDKNFNQQMLVVCESFEVVYK